MITMATNAAFHIILMTVLFCACSAVTVNVGDLGDIIEGSETRMMCNIVRTRPTSNADPLITWNNITSGEEKIVSLQGSNKFLAPDYTGGRFDVDINDGSLVISNTLRSDSGTYQCKVDISDDNPGKDDDDVVLDVIYLDTPSLAFSTPVIEGEMLELLCTTLANPEPLITFRKDGVSVQSGGQSSYVIQSVDRNDEGNYECEVMNGAGTKSTASQKLKVYYVPEISYLENKEVYPEETVVINFDVEANPAAAYEWTTNPATTDIDSNSNTYTFIVSETIDTMYSVTLNASNIVGATWISVNVAVVGPPPSTTSPCEFCVVSTVDHCFTGETCSRSVSTSAATAPVSVAPFEQHHAVIVLSWIIGGTIGTVAALFITVLIYKCCWKYRVKVCPETVNVGDDAVMRFKYCGQVSKASFTGHKCDESGRFDADPIVDSNKPKDDRFSLTKVGLQICNVKKTDDGYYSCVVTENGKEVKDFNKLTVIEKLEECPSPTGGLNETDETISMTECKDELLSTGGLNETDETIPMTECRDELSRYPAPGGELYTQVNLKQKNPEKETMPAAARVDKNVEGLTYADLNLTRN